jgi:hypothetical protein
MRDLHSNLGPAQSLGPKAVTTAEDGTGVDLAGFEGALAVLDCGTQAGTSSTFKLQESDALASGYTDVADADIIGGTTTKGTIVVTTTNDAQMHKRGYIGAKRYIRWILSAATSGNLPVSANVIRGLARHAPVA